MHEGREKSAWRHTAELLAMLANCHRIGFDYVDVDKNGHKHKKRGTHPRAWTADEFLPKAWRSAKSAAPPGRLPLAEIGIEALKVFLPSDDPAKCEPQRTQRLAEDAEGEGI